MKKRKQQERAARMARQTTKERIRARAIRDSMTGSGGGGSERGSAGAAARAAFKRESSKKKTTRERDRESALVGDGKASMRDRERDSHRRMSPRYDGGDLGRSLRAEGE